MMMLEPQPEPDEQQQQLQLPAPDASDSSLRRPLRPHDGELDPDYGWTCCAGTHPSYCATSCRNCGQGPVRCQLNRFIEHVDLFCRTPPPCAGWEPVQETELAAGKGVGLVAVDEGDGRGPFDWQDDRDSMMVEDPAAAAESAAAGAGGLTYTVSAAVYDRL